MIAAEVRAQWAQMKQDKTFFFKDPIPVRARLYVLAVITLGFAVALYCLSRIVDEASWQWLYLAGLTVVTSCFAIRIPLNLGKKGSLSISISDFCIFAALLLFGPAVAVVIAMIEAIISSLRVKIKRLYKVLFNVAQLALVAFVVGEVFYHLQGGSILLDGTQGLAFPALLVKVLFCSLLYFILNSVLVAAAMALVSRQSLTPLWKKNFLWASPTNLFNASVAAAVAFLTIQPIVFAFVLAVLPLILCTYYADRVNLYRQRVPVVD